MNHLVIFFIVLLSLQSCGTLTRVSQDIQADSRIESEDSLYLSRHIDALVKNAIAENLTRLSEQNIKIDRTIYSEPDSTGQQYVKETQLIDIETTTEENRILAVESVTNKNIQIDSIATSASVEDLEMEAITDTRMGLPWWQKSLMAIGGAVLLILLIKITRRILI